jgi:hypothetical protein
VKKSQLSQRFKFDIFVKIFRGNPIYFPRLSKNNQPEFPRTLCRSPQGLFAPHSQSQKYSQNKNFQLKNPHENQFIEKDFHVRTAISTKKKKQQAK